MRGTAFTEQTGDQPGISAIYQRTQQRMIRMMGLQDYRTRSIRSTRSTRDLHDQLTKSLSGSKVDAVQPLVYTGDNDEGQVGQIMSLCEHLRADQDPRPGNIKLVENRIPSGSTARRIAIDTHHRNIGKSLLQDFFDALGTLPLRRQRRARAFRTC